MIEYDEAAVQRAAQAIRDGKFLPTWMPDAVLADIARTVLDAAAEVDAE